MEGKKYKFTIGALAEFQELTGNDILFKGADLMNVNNAIALVFVGQKAAGGNQTLEEVKEMAPREFIKCQTDAINAFGDAFPAEEGKKTKQKKR
jgi:hypothetical protein